MVVFVPLNVVAYFRAGNKELRRGQGKESYRKFFRETK